MMYDEMELVKQAAHELELMKQATYLEWTAMGLVAIVVLATVSGFYYICKVGIPAFIAYLREKDASHRQDILSIMASGREERDKFYATLATKLDRVHDQIAQSKSEMRGEIGEVKDRLGRIETAIIHKT